MTKQITIAGKPVKVTVKENSKAQKTVKVEIKSKNQVTIHTPEGTKIDTDALLEKHRNILEKKYKQFLQRKPTLKDNKILYKGEYYKLNFQETKNPEKQVELEKNKLTIYHEPHSNPHRKLKEWMTQKTKQLIDEVKKKHMGSLEDPLIIRVADTTRWGYTRKNGVVIINWQLAALPTELSEYVIVHELAHLSKMNHHKQFKYKLAQLIPDYKIKDKALQNYITIDLRFN